MFRIAGLKPAYDPLDPFDESIANIAQQQPKRKFCDRCLSIHPPVDRLMANPISYWCAPELTEIKLRRLHPQRSPLTQIKECQTAIGKMICARKGPEHAQTFECGPSSFHCASGQYRTQAARRFARQCAGE
jgi:hypothetical protein